jgi:hypothetical protein
MKMLGKNVSLALLLPVGASLALAQSLSNTMVVGDNILVSGDVPARPHVEPCIDADPADAKHLIACASAFTRADGWFSVAVFSSFDGGRSWRRGKLESLGDFSFVGDAWTAFGPKGMAYLCCIGSSKSNASIVVFRSADGGREWLKPTTIPFGGGGAFDRCSIVADTGSSKFAGRVYVLACQSLGSKTGHYLSPTVVYQNWTATVRVTRNL